MGIKEGLIVAAAAVAPAFASSASQPYTEETKMTAQAIPAVACTVRLNRFHAQDYSTQDERYIGTQFEGDMRRNGKHGTQIFPSLSLSGIGYTQKDTLPNVGNIFWARKEIHPENVDVMLMPRSAAKDRLMPDGRYDNIHLDGHDSDLMAFPSEFTNWTESFETDIKDQRTCLLIKRSLVGHLPLFEDYGNILGINADTFANNVWKLTGKPSDADKLKQDPTVRFIDRNTRLQEDRASGQLKADPEIPPPFKPKTP